MARPETRISCRSLGATAAAPVLVAMLARPVAAQVDPLPSWNEGSAKSAILAFVKRVTSTNSPDFVPRARRIATFDNDGTLWSEKPFYFQLAFALDRVKALAPQHPEWKTKQPFKPIITRLPAVAFINDNAGKPVGINWSIGRRPIAAFGNSDGDLQMLQWTAAGAGS
jgi:hypothetical protein